MASSDSDDDLKRAIQLSLQTHQQEVINLDDDTTTDESGSDVERANRVEEKSLPEAALPASSSTGIFGLDRKAMEQERLARKRKAPISPPPIRKVARHSQAVSGKPVIDTPSNDHSKPAVEPSKLVFSNGTVRKTWAYGHPRQGDDIKLEEVLQKNDLSHAVLSSFQWDVNWLLRKINTKSTQIVFVMQAETEETKAQYRRETATMSNLRLCFPSMEGQVNCMHSKLMLLSYPTHLRVVVPTANLVPYDWGETGIMENTVFLIDLPRLPSGQEEALVTDFAKDLIYFLQALGLEQSIIDSIHQFDTSATKDLAFVHTIGGAHVGDEESWRRTGYCGLGRAITRLGLASNGNEALAVDYITSSVGSLNVDFISTLHLAAQGDDGMKEHEWRNTTLSKRDKAYVAHQDQKVNSQKQARQDVKQAFRIYYPSHDTIKASKGGPQNGGTICFQRKWWESPTFPHGLMRDCKSQRQGMLMHNKIMYVYPKSNASPTGNEDHENRYPDPRNNSNEERTARINRKASSKTSDHSSQLHHHSKAWAYIGSANCSESAWGKLVKDRTTKLPKLNCRNWECGVVVPARRAAATVTTPSNASGEEELDAVFGGVVPVPMEWPGEEYQGRKPWFYAE